MRRSIPIALASLLCLPLLSACSDTEAGGAGGSTATITQNGSTVTRTTSGSQTIVRQSGGEDGAPAARDTDDADAMLDSMRGRAGGTLER